VFNELYIQAPQGFSHYTQIVSETNDTGSSIDLSGGRLLPSTPISLPRDGSGVFEMYTDDTGGATSEKYVISSYEGYKNVTDSSFDTVGLKGYRVAAILNNKVYANGSIVNGQKVYYRMVPKFTSLSLNDEVIIPRGSEEMIIDRVIDTIQHMTPVDMLNDNTVQ